MSDELCKQILRDLRYSSRYETAYVIRGDGFFEKNPNYTGHIAESDSNGHGREIWLYIEGKPISRLYPESNQSVKKAEERTTMSLQVDSNVREVYIKNGKRTAFIEANPSFTGIVRVDGGIFYYKEGKLHREDGPAFIGNESGMKWYVYGTPIAVPSFHLNDIMAKYKEKFKAATNDITIIASLDTDLEEIESALGPAEYADSDDVPEYEDDDAEDDDRGEGVDDNLDFEDGDSEAFETSEPTAYHEMNEPLTHGDYLELHSRLDSLQTKLNEIRALLPEQKTARILLPAKKVDVQAPSKEEIAREKAKNKGTPKKAAKKVAKATKKGSKPAPRASAGKKSSGSKKPVNKTRKR